MKIKDLPNNERPRERLLKYGASNLSLEELLSIILKSGYKGISVKELSIILLKEIYSSGGFKNITINKLTKIKGIGLAKSIEIISSLELGKRVYYQKEKDNILLNTTTKIYEYFKDLFINETQENFYAIYLDTKSKLISYKLLFKGTLNTSCVHPREIFKYAFLESAYSIIVLHNHPSGDESPSHEDEELTISLMKIGSLIKIPVVDHIIIGNNSYFSFYEYMKNK